VHGTWEPSGLVILAKNDCRDAELRYSPIRRTAASYSAAAKTRVSMARVRTFQLGTAGFSSALDDFPIPAARLILSQTGERSVRIYRLGPTAMLETLPTLSQPDIERAIQVSNMELILIPPIPRVPLLISSKSIAHSSSLCSQVATTTPDDPKGLQHELFEMQTWQKAWGLVISLLEHQDPNVPFIGVHTAQVKIARDW
jgi:hypothetical protein